MQSSDEYKRQVLKRMGVEIWQLRNPSGIYSESPDTLGLPEVTDKVDIGSADTDKDEVFKLTERFPSTLDSLASEIRSCIRCHLHQSRSNTVPGQGSNQADWMFIGEAPGKSEDEQGLPFSGKAGKLLDAMLAALGMNRNGVFITNILKCRPLGNGGSLSNEMTLCSKFIHTQIELVQPKVIIAMGERSAQKILGTTGKMDSLRQRVHYYGSNSIPLIAMFDPGYLLELPEEKSKVWDDLLLARSSYRAS